MRPTPRGPHGPRLLALRRALGLTRAALGARLGYSHRTVAAWELGLLRPRAAVLAEIARLESYAADRALEKSQNSP